MPLNMKNPFKAASLHGIAKDVFFIGRSDEVQRLEEQFVYPPLKSERSCVAIIGLPDIGKHCLINKVLLSQKDVLYQKSLVTIKINLTTYTENSSYEEFFRALMSFCLDELDDEALEDVVNRAHNWIKKMKGILQEWDAGNRTYTTLKRFFKAVSGANIRVIFILDNFDHAVSVFREYIYLIKWIRELEKEADVIWIALSCKPIIEIKNLPPDISIGFFQEQRLRMFLEEDMSVYFAFFSQMNVTLTQEHKQKILYYCGRHPYLLCLLGYYIIDESTSQFGDIDVDRAFTKVEERFRRSYDCIIDLVLTNEGNEEKLQILQQILFRAAEGIEQKDINRMLSYGLIHPSDEKLTQQDSSQSNYLAFSGHFQDYLYNMWVNQEFQFVVKPREESEVRNSNSWSYTMKSDTSWKHYKIVGDPQTTRHSQVVKAYDTKLHRYVALKRLYVDASKYGNEGMEECRRRLVREATILGGIDYPNICLVYDVEKEEDPTIVMQWIEGKSLDKFGQGVFSSIQIVHLGIKLAKALEHIHTKEQPVIHRDIKPQNIIIKDNGEPVLIDFDIARIDGGGTITAVREGEYRLVGTVGYYAPEQRIDPKNVTFKVDIYALGVVLYEAFTGRKISFTYDQRIPASLWPIIEAMLSDDPVARPDASQLIWELESCLQELRNE